MQRCKPYRLRQCSCFPRYLHLFGLVILAYSTLAGSVPIRQPPELLKRDALPTLTTPIQLRKPSEIADDPLEGETTEPRSRLFNLDGNPIGDFVGIFQDITPDGRSVITYSRLAAQAADEEATPTYLYRPDGVELARLKGAFQGFTSDGQLIITYAQEQSYLYTLTGTKRATLDGIVRWSTLDGQTLVTDTGNLEQFKLYRADGTLISTFEGIFLGFSSDSQKLMTTDGQRSYLYTLDGTLNSVFEGIFSAFTPDSQHLITAVHKETLQSQLFALDGTLQATFKGEFTSFSPMESRLLLSRWRLLSPGYTTLAVANKRSLLALLWASLLMVKHCLPILMKVRIYIIWTAPSRRFLRGKF